MNLRRVIAVTAGMAVLAGGLLVGAAQAEQGRRGAGKWGDRGGAKALAALELTEAQRAQIRDIRQKHGEEMRQAMSQLRAAHRAQRQAASADPLDEGRVRATSQALADAHTQAAVLRARVRAEMLSVLTPEQRQKAETLRSEREQRMKERFDRKRQRGGRRG